MFTSLFARSSRNPRSLRVALIRLLSLVAILSSVALRPAFAAPAESRVFPALQRDAAKRPNDLFRVIVTRQKAAEKVGQSHVHAAKGKWVRQLKHEAFVAILPGRAIRPLGNNKGVKFIAPDAPIVNTCADCGAVSASSLATMYPTASGAAGLWPRTAGGTGWTGKGIGVAVLDTGINSNRTDWNDAKGVSRIVNAPIFSSGDIKREDGHGHGTHVAGIVGGNSWHRTTSSLKGKYVGIAPEATLIDVKVSDDRGASYISDLIDALDWVVTNREKYNIRVINMSLVSSVAESYKTSTLAAAVERAWFSGILVVVAAGNAGPDTLAYPPANDPFVITVGATDTMGTVDNRDDTMASWSSYGTTQDGLSKPDVAAPGRMITAPLTAANSSLGRTMSARIEDKSYIWLSGTSMAAPVVAGIGALAFQAHPDWTNDQVKWLLMQTATPLGPRVNGVVTSRLPGSGAGAVNAAAVVNYSGTPGVANQNIPISEQLIGPDGTLSYTGASSSSSWSSSSWSSSSWSSSSWSSSSWSSSSWSSSTGAVSCDSKCDASTDDTLPSGVPIPFEDPALELGLPAEPPVLAP